jgi:hypothetical protein
MMFPFVYQYAVDTTSTKVAALDLIPASVTDPTTVSDDTKNRVLNLVLGDTLSFASAAWYLKRSAVTGHTGCTQDIVDGLTAATQTGWEAYIKQCVDTTLTDPNRMTTYNLALANISPDPNPMQGE